MNILLSIFLFCASVFCINLEFIQSQSQTDGEISKKDQDKLSKQNNMPYSFKKKQIYKTLLQTTKNKQKSSANDLQKCLRQFPSFFSEDCIDLYLNNPSDLTDKQILQQSLDGMFQQNNMPYPTTIMNCIDDKTAKNIVNFTTVELQVLSPGVFTKFIQFLVELQKGYNKIDPQVHNCLQKNQQLTAWKAKYEIQNKSIDDITQQLVQNGSNNWATMSKWFAPLNYEWQTSNYHLAGFDTAKYLHLIFYKYQISDKQILQQSLNGMFQQNSMPYPTTIMNCIDDRTARNIVNFTTVELQQLSTGNFTKFLQFLVNLAKGYNKIDPTVHACLQRNQQLTSWKAKYGIQNKSIDDITNQLFQNASSNWDTMSKWFAPLNFEWKTAKYQSAGFDTAKYLHLIFNKELSQDKITLQQALNGMFKQNNMSQPTTIIDCLDDKTATNVVKYIASELQDLSTKDVWRFLSFITYFKPNYTLIDPQIRHCLETNQQLTAWKSKYGIQNSTMDDVTKKILQYGSIHWTNVSNWFPSLNKQWIAKDYYSAGYDASADLHIIYKPTAYYPISFIPLISLEAIDKIPADYKIIEIIKRLAIMISSGQSKES